MSDLRLATDGLLPANAKRLEQALALAATRLEQIPVPLSLAWDIDNSPNEFLPFLAYAYSVDSWSETWDDSTKRAIIKSSINLHGKKGTLWAVRTALQSRYQANVLEWFAQSPQVKAGTFLVELTPSYPKIADELPNIYALIDSVKRFSAHYSIALTVTPKTPLNVYGVAVVGIEYTLTNF